MNSQYMFNLNNGSVIWVNMQQERSTQVWSTEKEKFSFFCQPKMDLEQDMLEMGWEGWVGTGGKTGPHHLFFQ